MKSKDRIVIQKLIEYSKDIGKYIDGLDFEAFMNDKKTISASAFTIGQIGELVNNIDSSTQELYSQIPWRGIRGMRNRIVHNYEDVDLAVFGVLFPKAFQSLKNSLIKYCLLNRKGLLILMRDEARGYFQNDYSVNHSCKSQKYHASYLV